MLGSHLALARGSNDLCSVHRHFPIGTRQTDGAKLCHRGGDFRIGLSWKKEEIIVLDGQIRHFSAVDGMGVGNNQAFLRLAENLIQANRSKYTALQ